MSSPEEKATDSADAPARKDDAQQAVAAAAETATSSESADNTASSSSQEEAKEAPAAETAVPASAESKVDAAAESKVDAVGSTDQEVADELEIEIETVEEPAAEPDPIAELEAQVVELEAAKKTNYDRFLRASADLENYRKRSRRDVKDARLDERGKILRDMLPVIDNLERAVAHAVQTNAEATKSIVEGVNLVLRQFTQALERHNVTPLDSVGKTFDPALHEAVSQAPSAEHPPGTIISALQTGYMTEGRLLRPALVVVSVAMPAEAKPADEEPAEASAAAGEVIDVESSEASAASADSEEASAASADSEEASASDGEPASEAEAASDGEPASDGEAASDSEASADGLSGEAAETSAVDAKGKNEGSKVADVDSETSEGNTEDKE